MNTRDFTFNHYKRLLDTALENDYTFYTLRDYISTRDHDTPCIVIRHDIDRKVDTAREMAREEATRGITTTYYFRTSTFSPEVAREMEELGHEVGYHYEDLVKTRGDFEKAHDRFAENLERFREHADVQTVCPHGSPLSSHHNLDMWNGERTLEEYGLLGEAYLSMDTGNDDPEKASYVSDTGRSWEVPIAGFGRVETTDDLIEALSTGDCERYCLLVHPGRWSRTRGEHIQRLGWDIGAETAKAAMKATKYRANSAAVNRTFAKSEQFERRIEDEKGEGWKIKEDGDERVVLMKPDYGSVAEHVLVFLLTFWTFGFGNACWAAYRYFQSSDKKVVRDEQATVGQTQPSEPSIVEETDTGR